MDNKSDNNKLFTAELAQVGASSPEFGRKLAEAWSNLSEQERAVLGYLAEKGASGTTALSSALNISVRSVQRAVKELSNADLVSPHGQTNTRLYTLNIADDMEGRR